MNSAFLPDLDALKTAHLEPIVAAGQTSLLGDTATDRTTMLQVALANELGVSELAAAWIASTPELDVKLAFARQVGDEASHFRLVADRLTALGFDVADFRPPAANPLFAYLRGLEHTVERIAAGLYTLESIAHGVNENFMAFSERAGDAETVRIYREHIQPDELHHQRLGHALLAKYAANSASQQRAKEVVTRVLEIATATRATAAAKMGTACFPGC